MTQKEKSDAYDKIREKIAMRFGSNVADEIFSQFEMSDDEKIRKGIISAIKEDWPGHADWIAWLEKQGEHANFRNKIQIGDKVTRNEDGVLVNLSQLKRVAKPAEEYNITGIDSKHAEGKLGEMIKRKLELEKQREKKPADNVIEEEKPLLEKFKQAVYDCAWEKVTCKKEGETKEEYANRWAEHFLLIVRDWADDYIDFTIQQKLRNSYEKGKTDIIKKQGEQKPFSWTEDDGAKVKAMCKDGNLKPSEREWLINLRYRVPEQKHTDKIEPKFKVGDRVIGVISGMPYFITEVCDDYYNTESGCIIMFCAQDNFELYEQKSAWSGEDERLCQCIIEDQEEALDKVSNDKYGHSEIISDLEEIYRERIAFLKSLKDRVQPKQEWSEEDEPQKELAETYLAVFDKKFPILPTLKGKQLADYKNFLNKCQQIFGLKYWDIRPLQAKLFEKLSLLWAAWGAEHLKGLGQTDGDTDNEKQEWSEEDEKVIKSILNHYKFMDEEWVNWLKSIKERVQPQNIWKPSDEQMRVLDLAIRCGINRGTTEETTLVSLFNDLKKLKG